MLLCNKQSLIQFPLHLSNEAKTQVAQRNCWSIWRDFLSRRDSIFREFSKDFEEDHCKKKNQAGDNGVHVQSQNLGGRGLRI